MKIIVTGGAGFIGSHLVDRLVRDGWGDVVIVDNLFRGKVTNISHHLSGSAVTFLKTDIRDYERVCECFSGAEVVFHLAAQSNVIGAVNDIDYSFTTNVTGTLNVLKAAQACGVRRLVFTSSREVYGEATCLPVSEDHPLNSKNAYGASKVAGEAYCRVFNAPAGLRTSVVRLANVYGPRDVDRVIPIWIERALQGLNLIVYGGQQLIDFVWVDTVVEALLRMARSDAVDAPVNIGSGKGISILELAQRTLALAGTSSTLDLRPARAAEVTRFAADVTRMNTWLGLQPPADPLFALALLMSIARGDPSGCERPEGPQVTYADAH
ncbi:MAG: NAD-dependent epimerase/dehydratase family protein [Chloroflexi bacterium]|nr:NAD-dependent epimerase/dehydratase family protein [Chloroflexota bacterium]